MPIEGVKNTRKGGLNWVLSHIKILFENNPLFKNLVFDNDNDKYARRKDKEFYPGSLDNNQATPVHPTQVISPYLKDLIH